MTRYAASMTDLDRVWRTPAGCALLDSTLDGQEGRHAEVVTAGGADASVLRADEARLVALIEGLLAQEVRVYEQADGIPGVTRGRWVRIDEAPDAPEPPEESDELTGEFDWPHIDAEFAALCGMQTPAERAGLRESIVEHGCRDPLVVWEEREILLDGHNRLAVCHELDVPYDTVEYSFPNRDAARAWIIDNALARRSLTAPQRRYLRGKRLLSEKKQGARTDLTSPQIEGKSEGTAGRIAEREGVSRATVERDAEFARALDALGTTARVSVLTGQVKISRGLLRTAVERGVRSPNGLRDLKRASAAPIDPFAQLDALAARVLRLIDAVAAQPLSSESRERVANVWAVAASVERLAKNWPEEALQGVSEGATDG